MKTIKTIFTLTIFLMVIVVGGAIAFIVFADPNDFKERIAAKVFEQTGRTLTLAGDLDWTIWPKIRLKAGPFALSNAPGFGNEPFLAADEFQIAIATLPLLKKQIEMDTVKLYGARINLASNADGVTNWEDLTGDDEAQEGGSAGSISAIALGGVDVQDGTITWREAASEKNIEITKLNVSTGPLMFGDPIAFNVSLAAFANQPKIDSELSLMGTVSYNLKDEKYHIEPLNLDIEMRGAHLQNGKATLTTTAIVNIDLEAGIAKISQLALSGLGVELNGDVEAIDIESEAPGARGAISLKGNNLALVFNALELPVAKQISKLKDRVFNFTTEFDADMQSGSVSVPTLKGTVLGANVNASLEAERVNTDKPTAKGELSAQGPDLPSLLAVIGQLQGMEPKTLDDLNKVLSNAKNRGFALQTSFDADMKIGQIDLPTFEAHLFGNSISGNVTSNETGGEKPSLTGNVNASGPDLPSLIAIAATFQGAKSGLHDISKSLSSSPNKAFSLNSSFATDLNKGNIDLPKLSVIGLGLVIDGKLTRRITNGDKDTINGHLSVRGEKVNSLLEALGQKDLAASIDGLSLDAGINGTMTDLTVSPLTLLAKVNRKNRSNPVDLTLTAGAAHMNLEKETLTVNDLSLTGLGMNVGVNINASKIKTEPTITGNVNIPVFNLRQVLNGLNQEIPPMADPNALTAFALNTEFYGTSKSVALSKLDMALDQSILRGDLAIDDFEGADVRFALGIDQINADAYMRPTQKGYVRPITPEAAAVGATQLPIETLRKIKIAGDLIVGRLQISGAKLRDAKLSINAADGSIKINPLAASLYDGNYDGIIDLDATTKVPRLTIDTKLTGINVEPLLFDLTGNRSLSGTANLSTNLVATGNDSDALKRNLSGPLNFLIENGVYRGIDVATILSQIEVMVETKRPGVVQKGGETKFQTLAGTINFQNGVGSNNDLLLDGSGFKVTGNGIVANLNNDTMKYDALVSVESARSQQGESTYNLGGYSVPIKCRGKFGADTCKPDIGDIVAEIAKSAVTKEIGRKLEDVLGGGAGKALKKLFRF